MTRDYYVLKGRRVVPVKDVLEWARCFEGADRIIAQRYYGRISVSTVFLGLDHQWGDGPPLVFETMIFGGLFDQYQERYSTYDQAEAGHAVACELVERWVGLHWTAPIRNFIVATFWKPIRDWHQLKWRAREWLQLK